MTSLIAFLDGMFLSVVKVRSVTILTADNALPPQDLKFVIVLFLTPLMPRGNRVPALSGEVPVICTTLFSKPWLSTPAAQV